MPNYFLLAVGVLAPGPLNAITDVAGVKVGHVTLRDGQNVRTGVTAVLPHGGNIFQDKVPAGISVANGSGVSGNPTPSVDTATTPQFSSGTGLPGATCTVGQYLHGDRRAALLRMHGHEHMDMLQPSADARHRLHCTEGWLDQ